MKKIYLIDENTDLTQLKFSKDDILYSIDIKTYVLLKRGDLNVFYLGSLLNAKGHIYIAKNTMKYINLIKNFTYKDPNNLQKTYFINLERKLYFFLSNYFYINFVYQKFLKKYKKKYKIINLLKNNFDPNIEINNNNNLFNYFFLNKKKIKYEKFNYNKKIYFFKKSLLSLIFVLTPKNYLGILPDDKNLKKFVIKQKNKYKFNSIIFFNSNRINYLKKIFYYLFPIYKISENLFLDYRKDINLNSQLNNILNDKNFSLIKDKKLSYLLKIYFNNYLLKYLYSLSSKSINLYNFLKNKKPKLIIAKRSNDLAYSIGETSKKLNFDSILISHASHIYNKNKLSMFDWIINSKSTINSDFKFIASQSKFSDVFLKKINAKSVILQTGPIILTSPSKSFVKNKINKVKIILHASTPKNVSNFRSINYETTFDYIENLKQQIIALKDNKNVYFIIKFREYDFLKLDDFKYLMPKTSNYEIDTSSNLKNLLDSCDYLSSYSSTVIEEALFFGKDIILYDRNKIYKHLSKSKYTINNNKTSKVYYTTKPSSLKNIFK